MQDAGFTLGMVALAIIIAIGAYFVLYSPALDAKAEAESAANEAAEFNDFLEIQLQQKQAEAKRLPEFEARLDEMKIEVPEQDLIAEVRRDVDAVFEVYGVQVSEGSLIKPSLVVPGSLSLAGPAAAVGRTSYVEGLGFQDVYSASLEMTVRGDFSSVLRAVSALQMDQERYYLIENLQSTGAASEGAQATYSFTLTYFVHFDGSAQLDPGAPSDPDSVTDDPRLGPLFQEAPAA